MRRILLMAAPLLFAPALLALAGAEQPVQNTLPNPDDYVAAGPYCERKVKVSPWVGTPAVNWPKTYQCELVVHTCHGPKTYRSSVRPGGTGMCDDHWRVHDALASREICCDQGSREPEPDEQPNGP
jgi:hypothetical protein